MRHSTKPPFFVSRNFVAAFFILSVITALMVARYTSSSNPGNLIKAVESEKDGDKQVKLMRQLVYEMGPKSAIDFLNNSSIPKSGQAHLLSHQIGEVAYDLYKTNAFDYCEQDMLNGCTHGLIIAAVSDIGFEGVKKMVDNCQKFSTFKRNMCLHASGHGFAALEDYDIFAALSHCDKLIDPNNQASIHCYNGVFMENAQGEHNGLIPEQHPYLDKENPEKPCNVVGERYRAACYLAQPAWWRFVFDGNTQKTAELCASIETRYQDECADSLGRMVFTDFNYELDKIEDNCRFLPGALFDKCLTSIAKFAFSLGNEDFPFMVCGRVSPNGKELCYIELTEHFREHGVLLRPDSPFCHKIEKEYRYLCES